MQPISGEGSAFDDPGWQPQEVEELRRRVPKVVRLESGQQKCNHYDTIFLLRAASKDGIFLIRCG